MILKYATSRDNETAMWNYVDGIKDASVFFDNELQCTCVNITRYNGDEFGIALHNTAYLLNESGKTIERLTL